MPEQIRPNDDIEANADDSRKPKIRYFADDPRSPESTADRGGLLPTPEEVAKYLINDWEFKGHDLQSLTEKIASGEIPYGITREIPEPEQPRTDPRDWSNDRPSTSGFPEVEPPRKNPRDW
jgi:hypothetical protein